MDEEAEAVLNWMKGTKVKDHFTKDEEDWYSFRPYTPSYKDLFVIAGNDILLDETLGSYQGDYLFYLVNKFTGKHGFVVVGYGSCSGCDALEACDTIKDLQSLQDDVLGEATLVE